MNGDPDHNIKLLPSLVQSLLDCGHYAAVTTINPEEMRAIMTANAQSNYDLAVKAAKKLAEAQAKKGWGVVLRGVGFRPLSEHQADARRDAA